MEEMRGAVDKKKKEKKIGEVKKGKDRGREGGERKVIES